MNINILKFTTIILLLCCSCGNKNEIDVNGQSLIETTWKLAGIVDTQTGILKVLEREGCADCYSFTFDTDSTAFGISIVNHLGVSLRPIVRIFVMTYALDNHWDDTALFYNAISSIISYKLNKNELKFYYNDNKNYLLFKSQKS